MKLCLILVLFLSAVACQPERIPIPKPRSYPKVEFPKKNTTTFDKDYCQFSFEHPDYFRFERDSTYLNQKAKHMCWFNLHCNELNSTLHFTYTDIRGENAEELLFDAISDAYELTEKHNLKANSRTSTILSDTTRQLYGIKYDVGGNVASPHHFVLTDSVQHALWVALYFYSAPNADSMRPVIDFMHEDIIQLIETFQWQS